MLFTCLVWASLALMPQMTEKEAVELATRTLAQELRVEKQGIELVRAVSMSWPDGSLGCASGGRSYIQVVIPGYRVDLKSGGRVHRVHVGDGRAVYCRGAATRLRLPVAEGELSLTPPSSPEEGAEPSVASPLSQLAKEDLASRLDVDADEIEVAFIDAVTWHDTSLGCPEEGKTYETVETEGSIIGLVHQGTTYEYHADEVKPVLCEGRYSR